MIFSVELLVTRPASVVFYHFTHKSKYRIPLFCDPGRISKFMTWGKKKHVHCTCLIFVPGGQNPNFGRTKAPVWFLTRGKSTILDFWPGSKRLQKKWWNGFVPWDTIQELMGQNPRIGSSSFFVPGWNLKNRQISFFEFSQNKYSSFFLN